MMESVTILKNYLFTPDRVNSFSFPFTPYIPMILSGQSSSYLTIDNKQVYKVSYIVVW